MLLFFVYYGTSFIFFFLNFVLQQSCSQCYPWHPSMMLCITSNRTQINEKKTKLVTFIPDTYHSNEKSAALFVMDTHKSKCSIWIIIFCCIRVPNPYVWFFIGLHAIDMHLEHFFGNLFFLCSKYSTKLQSRDDIYNIHYHIIWSVNYNQNTYQ